MYCNMASSAMTTRAAGVWLNNDSNSSFHRGPRQPAAGAAGLIQALFEVVVEGHQFIDFLDDALLLFKWGKGTVQLRS